MDLSRDRLILELELPNLHFWKNWITAPVAGQRHNNGVAFSLESVPRTLCWAKVVFSFRPVLRLLLGNDNKQVVFSFWSVLRLLLGNDNKPLPRERIYRAVFCFPFGPFLGSERAYIFGKIGSGRETLMGLETRTY
jgi:hypothetical protein